MIYFFCFPFIEWVGFWKSEMGLNAGKPDDGGLAAHNSYLDLAALKTTLVLVAASEIVRTS